MIASLEGVMGSGKSLTAAALVYEDHVKLGRRVISNNHLNFPYQHFDLQYFLDNIASLELTDCDLLLDESYLYLDSRTSSGKLNKLFTYFTAQTRKRGVDMYICIHHIDTVDKRLRRAIDVRGTCRYRKEKPCSKCPRCSTCGGSGNLGGLKCPDCRGSGGSGIGKKSVVCLKCAGSGHVGEVKCAECGGAGKLYEPCDRCLGYGETGWATTRFFDRRSGKRTRVTIFGPAYWYLYSTEELVPFTKKMMKISAGDI